MKNKIIKVEGRKIRVKVFSQQINLNKPKRKILKDISKLLRESENYEIKRLVLGN